MVYGLNVSVEAKRKSVDGENDGPRKKMRLLRSKMCGYSASPLTGWGGCGGWGGFHVFSRAELGSLPVSPYGAISTGKTISKLGIASAYPKSTNISISTQTTLCFCLIVSDVQFSALGSKYLEKGPLKDYNLVTLKRLAILENTAGSVIADPNFKRKPREHEMFR